jgi:NodT family efflux transporter outer membrane factor (OMF) lipoprotein
MRKAIVLTSACLSIAIAALAGCASVAVPDLHQDLPADWRLAETAARQPTPDLEGWWHAFGDFELDSLVIQALSANKDVAAARERLIAARVLRSHTYDRLLPQLAARTNDVVDPDASASFFVAGFDATWELDLFGRGRALKNQARGADQAAQAALAAARVSLVADVVANWLKLRDAQARLITVKAIVDARTDLLRQANARVDLHLGTSADVTSASIALDQARASFAEPRALADASAQRLAVLLDLAEPRPEWLEPGKLPTLTIAPVRAVPADLLRFRPEIAAAEAAVFQAAGEAGLANADRYPHVALGGSLVWSTDITSHRSRGVSRGLGSVGPIIDIPLFDWGQRAAAADARQHELMAATYAYRSAVLEGVADAETALGALAANQARLEAMQHMLDTATADVDVQTRRQALRLAGSESVGRAAVAQAEARLEYLQALRDEGLAYVSLYKALGGAPRPDGELAAAGSP